MLYWGIPKRPKNATSSPKGHKSVQISENKLQTFLYIWNQHFEILDFVFQMWISFISLNEKVKKSPSHGFQNAVIFYSNKIVSKFLPIHIKEGLKFIFWNLDTPMSLGTWSYIFRSLGNSSIKHWVHFFFIFFFYWLKIQWKLIITKSSREMTICILSLLLKAFTYTIILHRKSENIIKVKI